ncbi:MAG: hypothetical protein E6J61_01700 [Deltaproteobacteria bacterium]|nr:MAG: hypothetical protein E6J61_01700 [Deltaproteobacteria bacterium]
MHETCNVRERPFATDGALHSLERLAPEDPLFDGPSLEDLREYPRRPHKRLRTAPLRAAAVAALITSACGDPSSQPVYATDAVLVRLDPGATLPPPQRGDDAGPPIVQVASVAPADSDPILRVPVPAGQTPDEYARSLSAQPGIALAEPIAIYTSSKTPNDSRYKELWGLKAIDVESAWSTTVGDRAIAVAVIDDGVAMTHSDLAANIWVNPEESSSNGRDDDGDGLVDDVHGWDFVDNDAQPGPASSGAERWHGSHVSGTIGAVGDNRAGVVGVNWKVSIMALRAIIGALNPDGTLASFSNRGAMLTAPGVGILSTTAPGQYARYDGTSMAAPHVSGAAALLWSARPAATLAQVKKALLESAGRADKKIDVAKALDALGVTGGGGDQAQPPHLSRAKLEFAAASGKTPRAQTITLRQEGGGSKQWVAKTDAGWIQLAKTSGEAPARLTVRVDPAGLSSGAHTGHVAVSWADQPSARTVLEVSLRVGTGPAIAVDGPCALRDDALHVPAGSSCAISLAGLAPGVTASSVQWRLPGGELVRGGLWYGRFLRRGTYDLQVTASEEGTDGISVVVE